MIVPVVFIVWMTYEGSFLFVAVWGVLLGLRIGEIRAVLAERRRRETEGFF